MEAAGKKEQKSRKVGDRGGLCYFHAPVQPWGFGGAFTSCRRYEVALHDFTIPFLHCMSMSVLCTSSSTQVDGTRGPVCMRHAHADQR